MFLRRVLLENYKSIAACDVELGALTILVGPNGSETPWRFLAANMSDGTLRALGILVSLAQSGNGDGTRIRLVGIEEPEVALHPAATGALVDALREASSDRQLIVTSHSPDLLDLIDVQKEKLLAVHAEKGATVIAEIDEASRKTLEKGLYTPGELLRLNQLTTDPPALVAEQIKLFERT